MVSMKGYLRRNVARVLLALLLATSLVALFPWAAVPAHVGAATVIDEFPIPTVGGSPYAIAAGLMVRSGSPNSTATTSGGSPSAARSPSTRSRRREVSPTG